MAGVAGSGLSGAAGRLAAPLRGMWQARPLEQVLRGLQARGQTSRADGCIWRVHSHAAASNTMRFSSR